MINPDDIFGRIGNRLFQGAYLIAQVQRGEIDDIYVQDPYYFDEYKDIICGLYRQGIPEKTDMVAIHVRRGDYVGNDFYVDLIKTDYYKEAMEMFPGSKFLVFSDNIEFCKRHFVGKEFEFYHGTEIEDMNMMASCIGHIIANSSFSWWGAYISPYTQKVIAPNKYNWYNDGKERTKCPVAWVRL